MKEIQKVFLVIVTVLILSLGNFTLYNLICCLTDNVQRVNAMEVSEVTYLPDFDIYESDLQLIEKINNDNIYKNTVAVLSTTQEELQGIVEENVENTNNINEKQKKKKQKEKQVKPKQNIETKNIGINNSNNNFSKLTSLNSYQFINKNEKIDNNTFKKMGIVYYNNIKMTYYSDKVLPGGGLNIPNRHYEDNFIVDKDGYIVAASNINIPLGTIYNTPFGKLAKVYDRCEACDINWIDIYVH